MAARMPPPAPNPHDFSGEDSEHETRGRGFFGVFVPLALGLVSLGVWLVVQWNITRPAAIEASWRECDTQAIARNFHRSLEAGEGLDLLRPSVDWGGAGAGHVEAELQLFTAAIALAMTQLGEEEWIGQLLSLGCFLMLGLGVYAIAVGRYGHWPALAAMLAVLSSRMGVQLSISVMPDALSLLLYTFGLLAFLAYADRGSLGGLVLAGLLTAAAAMVKAPSLQLGIVQFLLLCFHAPRRLGSPWPWVVWALVLVSVGAQLNHANSVYLESGLTFGILAGGDVKFPGLQHLTSPGVYLDLVGLSLRYGIGVLGAMSLVYLVARGRLRAFEIALLLSNAVGLLVSMRYSADPFAGPHYHAHTMITGALLLAHALWDLARLPISREIPRVAGFTVAMALGLQLTLTVLFETERRTALADADTVLLGEALGSLIGDDELVTVRSPKPEVDPYWGRRNNYEEPTLLYAADARGFVLPSDRLDPAELAGTIHSGARWYAEPGQPQVDPELGPWLDRYGELVHDGPEGRLWRLSSAEIEPQLQPETQPQHQPDLQSQAESARLPIGEGPR